KTMNESALDTIFLCHAQQRVKVVLVGVNAAIRNQSENVQPPVACARLLHRVEQHRVAEELAALDHHVNASNVHVHDASGADVQVTNFAVADLAFGQAHI